MRFVGTQVKAIVFAISYSQSRIRNLLFAISYSQSLIRNTEKQHQMPAQRRCLQSCPGKQIAKNAAPCL
ncbi:MAG: hypothetical protein CMM01_03980 [Rhodopirellula sp.]|nr:hypothetical protein [Rhodopirellula sp.]